LRIALEFRAVEFPRGRGIFDGRGGPISFCGLGDLCAGSCEDADFEVRHFSEVGFIGRVDEDGEASAS
jgi:hypothetical protein